MRSSPLRSPAQHIAQPAICCGRRPHFLHADWHHLMNVLLGLHYQGSAVSRLVDLLTTKISFSHSTSCQNGSVLKTLASLLESSRSASQFNSSAPPTESSTCSPQMRSSFRLLQPASVRTASTSSCCFLIIHEHNTCPIHDL